MVFGDGAFRSRAASLLRPSTPSANHSFDASRGKGPSEQPLNEKQPQDTERTELEQTQTTPSGNKTHHPSGLHVADHDKDAQRLVRTIPGEQFLLRKTCFSERLDECFSIKDHAASRADNLADYSLGSHS